MVMGIGYDHDIDKTKIVMTDVVAADERVLKNPAPLIAMIEPTDSSVIFVVRPRVKSDD